ncbi:MAG TPA: hypothetical protein VFS21_40200 [Roseiflexaceae bacterium]|nr:hypothetical protein [Roseiflexaceae bacterium]
MALRWWTLALLVCGLGGLALLAALSAAQQRRYDEARAQWTEHAPPRYVIDFALTGDEVSGSFRATIEGQTVRSVVDQATGQAADEAVVRALAPVLPVESLFERIADAYTPTGRLDHDLARRSPAYRAVFGPLGLVPYPRCWSSLVQALDYDPALGYPRRLSWQRFPCDDGMFSLDAFDLEITALRPA